MNPNFLDTYANSILEEAGICQEDKTSKLLKP